MQVADGEEACRGPTRRGEALREDEEQSDVTEATPSRHTRAQLGIGPEPLRLVEEPASEGAVAILADE